MLTVNEEKVNKLLASSKSKLSTTIIANLSVRGDRNSACKPKYIVKSLTWDQASRMIKDIFRRLNLLEESNLTKRAVTFIGFCKYRGYSLATTRKYFNEAKRIGVFGENISIIPDALYFDKHVHQRLISDDVFSKFVSHLQANWSMYTAPLLTAFYTGLRSNEILQIDTKILNQLSERRKIVDIVRKDTRNKTTSVPSVLTPNHWKPVYYENFNKFIKSLLVLYEDKYNGYLKHGINSQLFDVSGPSTLVYRMHIEFYKANNFFPPKGFGIHIFRNQIARKLASKCKNIHIIKEWLGHKNIKTTKGYINEYYNNMGKEFDKLTDKHYAEMKNLLSMQSYD
ncbi:uncharacterized protein LOC128390498 [Panonychus citri]|uniref:uncharacterized protein LOC128390498 n=1 Tax=Panonychus citri TaxID=50023 RepID=UPI002306E194|nr:uncharacterized protein LOC128390498 [Panonychus citri]